MQHQQYDGVILEDKWGKTYLCSTCLLAYHDFGQNSVSDISDAEFGRYFLHDLEPQWNRRQIWADMYQQARPWQSDISGLSDYQLRDAVLSLLANNEMWVWPLTDGWGKAPEGNGLGEGGLAPATTTTPAKSNKGTKPKGGALIADNSTSAKVAGHEGALADKVLPLSARRNNPPSSMQDAANRLAQMKNAIASNGYQPKYTDAELAAMAQSGEVANERFHVRFMKKSYLQDYNNPTVPLSGKLGQVMQGESGTGAKYWSTTFDQIEDADTDAELISNKLGLQYEPAEYVLLIIDTHKAAPLTGVKSVSATFKNVAEFANTELPDSFPASFTDKTMNPEYQALYAEHYKTAVADGHLKRWSTDKDRFRQYLNTTDLSDGDKDCLLQRMEMHKKIGNNEDYLGTGLTKDLTSSNNLSGAFETLNFERSVVDLKTLKDNDSLLLISL